MTLLTACQDVADVIGLPRPTAIISSQDQLSRQMLGLARETLEELGEMDWPILQVPFQFDTVIGQDAYELPADFARDVGDTTYLASQYYQMRGSLTPGDWARQRNALPSQLGQYKYRIFGLPKRKIYITPSPMNVETVVMEYATRNRVISVDNTMYPTFQADSDTPIMPEQLLKKGLKWRVRRAKGLDYSEEFDDYEMSRAQSLAQDFSFGSQPVAYRNFLNTEAWIADGYVPEFGYGQ